MSQLLDEHGNELPRTSPQIFVWYSEGKDAKELLEKKIDIILAAYAKIDPNAKVRIQSYGERPNEIKEKIISIGGEKVAKVTFINETESGNQRIELVTTIDLGEK